MGPIDPQVFNGKELVPALGYLDQVEKFIQKSADNELTEAELILLQNQDLAALSQYEQAKNLTVTLLKKWLVEHKFKDWTQHSSTGKPVTPAEKQARAAEIATTLSDNRIWHSHGRKIGIKTLTGHQKLRLQIDDYSLDYELRARIRQYSNLLMDYIKRYDHRFFLHSRCHFWHPFQS